MFDLAQIRIRGGEDGVEDEGEVDGVYGGGEGGGDHVAGTGHGIMALFGEGAFPYAVHLKVVPYNGRCAQDQCETGFLEVKAEWKPLDEEEVADT